MTMFAQAVLILCVALGIFVGAAFLLGAHNPEPVTADYPGMLQIGRRE